MPKTELKENLNGLKVEVDKLDTQDDPKVIHLNGIIKDVELKIIDSDNTPTEVSTIVSDIEQTIENLEVEYPKITRTLNRIMNILSNIGI